LRFPGLTVGDAYLGLRLRRHAPVAPSNAKGAEASEGERRLLDVPLHARGLLIDALALRPFMRRAKVVHSSPALTATAFITPAATGRVTALPAQSNPLPPLEELEA
jgi:hypothetical protein